MLHGFKSRLAHHKKRNPVVIETAGFSLFINDFRVLHCVDIFHKFQTTSAVCRAFKWPFYTTFYTT
nr:MAG TPA: hypothetical protein [Caudoviricetes sp.]